MFEDQTQKIEELQNDIKRLTAENADVTEENKEMMKEIEEIEAINKQDVLKVEQIDEANSPIKLKENTIAIAQEVTQNNAEQEIKQTLNHHESLKRVESFRAKMSFLKKEAISMKKLDTPKEPKIMDTQLICDMNFSSAHLKPRLINRKFANIT